MADVPMETIAADVLEKLTTGMMTPEQQRVHAEALLENDEYFETFFFAVEVWAAAAKKGRRSRERARRHLALAYSADDVPGSKS